MNCPRCDVELKTDNIREFGLTCNAHKCSACEGYWIGAEQLTEIEMDGQQRLVEFRTIPSTEKQYQVLKCPQCAGQPRMDKVQNERDKKVVMDVCPECKNIWLDGGEMRAIKQEGFAALIADTVRWFKSK